MRILQKKRIRRQLQLYKLQFGIQEPFKVLVDGELIRNALDEKIYLKDELPKILQGRCYMVVTNCVVSELRKKGEDYKGAALFAKRLQRAKCDHSTAVSANECMKSVIGESNPEKYCVAVQDQNLRYRLSRLPGVPIVFLYQNRCQLGVPSKATKEESEKITHEKMALPEEEKERLAVELKQKEVKGEDSKEEEQDSKEEKEALKKKGYQEEETKGSKSSFCKKEANARTT